MAPMMRRAGVRLGCELMHAFAFAGFDQALLAQAAGRIHRRAFVAADRRADLVEALWPMHQKLDHRLLGADLGFADLRDLLVQLLLAGALAAMAEVEIAAWLFRAFH